ncbi:MAG: hypothetical protein K0R15_1476 [Clostridiales bacterium]|jgi:hypothetical protein|nr:hypothetical protein [Clostridiales bacterium]
MNWLEWLGYLASLIVLISLLMSSIIKLRWINLLGSAIFAVYGFSIGAFPVGFMNLCTCSINIYYLVKIYKTKEYFKILPFESSSLYYKQFLEYYKSGIEMNHSINDSDVCFFILRNMVPAGVFVASKHNDNTLKIELDFVIPEYRDFKIGKFIFENSKDFFLNKGYSKFIYQSSNDTLDEYFKKMGFKQESVNGSNYFVKSI